MEPEVKRLWVDALRSGEYEQAIGRVKRAGAYCALGVLLHVAAEYSDDLVTEAGDDFYPAWDGSEVDGGPIYDLPSVVLEWAGLNDAMETVIIEMNDDEGRPFGEIADYIEEHY